METIDVIIPSKTREDILPIARQTIRSLRQSEDEMDFNVVIVESNSKNIEIGQDATIMYDRDDFSYNRALNIGIQATSNEWVVLANNDLIFHDYWFKTIQITHNVNPEYESFSPWNDMHNWHRRIFPDNKYNLIPGYNICRELVGWCIVVKRSVLDRIGPLSERCSLWYSDNIYADALIEHGIKHALVANSFVDHLTSQTINFNEYMTEVDFKKYQEGLNK